MPPKESWARLFQTKAAHQRSPTSPRTHCHTKSLAESSPREVEPWCKHGDGFSPISKGNQISVLFSLLEFYLGAISSISSSRTGAILTIAYLSMLLFDLLEPPNPRLNLFELDCGTVPPPVKYCHSPWTPCSAHRAELPAPASGSVLPGISSILRAIFILDLGPSHATPLACGY